MPDYSVVQEAVVALFPLSVKARILVKLWGAYSRPNQLRVGHLTSTPPS